VRPAGTGYPSLQEIKSYRISSRKKKPTVDLGLDLSSSCVGWALGVDRRIVYKGKFAFKTTADIGEKLVSFEEFIETLLAVFQPNRVYIEKPLSRKGSTTARHFELLGIVRKVWRQASDKEVLDSWLISARTIKTVMMVERSKDHKENKRRMVEKINNLYGFKLRFHPNSCIQSDDDTADACAVLTTAWRRNTKGR
jgi:Holliday junction resolvasome RuvABC endonuclease subunit